MPLLCDDPRSDAQLDHWVAEIERYQQQSLSVSEEEKPSYQDAIVRLQAKIEQLRQ